MDLDITLPRPGWLTGLVLPKLDAIELEHLSGGYDGDTDALDLDITLHRLIYDSIKVSELNATINSTGPVLNGTINCRTDRT